MGIPSLIAARQLDGSDYHSAHFVFARSGDGELISWHPATIAHRRITGTTGSGKSTVARSFAVQAAGARWAVHCLAHHGYEYADLLVRPTVETVVAAIDDRVEAVHRLWEMMRQRLHDGGEHSPVLVVIDEFDDLAARSGALVSDELNALIRLGRQARIHLVAIMGQPPVNYDIINNTHPIDITADGRVSHLHRLVRAASGSESPLYQSARDA